jgi:predicted GNAT family acetyltransferase
MTEAEKAGLLDDPAWAALTTGNRAVAQGSPLAWRYPPEIAPFAAIADRTAASFAALATLVPTGDRIALATVDPVVPPSDFVIAMQLPVLQMVLNARIASQPSEPSHIVLGPPDVTDMLDLAGRTRPGPFGPRTLELGHYIGLRVERALVAMAGERMRLAGFVEISAVCVDPDHRGKGLAALLVTRLVQRIQAQDLTPFLHVFADNLGAIALYQRLGFTRRRAMHVTVLAKRPD